MSRGANSGNSKQFSTLPICFQHHVNAISFYFIDVSTGCFCSFAQVRRQNRNVRYDRIIGFAWHCNTEVYIRLLNATISSFAANAVTNCTHAHTRARAIKLTCDVGRELLNLLRSNVPLIPNGCRVVDAVTVRSPVASMYRLLLYLRLAARWEKTQTMSPDVSRRQTYADLATEAMTDRGRRVTWNVATRSRQKARGAVSRVSTSTRRAPVSGSWQYADLTRASPANPIALSNEHVLRTFDDRRCSSRKPHSFRPT
jgi:hypothetical protein